MKENFLQLLRTRIFFKSLASYAILLLLNISLQIIIILYNQSGLAGKVEIQDLYLENLKFRKFLSSKAEEMKISGDDRDRVIQLIKKSGMSMKSGTCELSLFDANGRLLMKKDYGNPLCSAEESESSSLDDKRMALKLIFKYRIDRTGSLYNIKSESLMNSFLIFQPGGNIYVLKTSRQLREMRRLSRVLFFQVLVVFFISLVIHSLFTYLIYKNIIRPLKNLNAMTKKVMEGDFTGKINYKGGDEIGELSNSFNEMTMAINNLRNEALDSNPLTGLPGNNVIMRTVNQWLEKGSAFALAYVDLDNFKPFNDKFGFETGDTAIILLSEVLKDICKENPGVFVGHTGGDDFVFLSDYQDYEKIGNKVIHEFSRRSEQLYSPEVIQRGYYISKTRSGEIKKFRLLSISIGVVTNNSRKFASYSEIVQEVTKMKKYAKNFEGNTLTPGMFSPGNRKGSRAEVPI